jgi:(2Fe-2S) ferredoxin
VSFYNNHVFICNNQKDNNKQCCANANTAELISYAKQRAKELRLTKETKFRISSSGCMGQCAIGPVLVVYPAGTWYTYNSKDDIDKILMSIAAGKICQSNLITQ